MKKLLPGILALLLIYGCVTTPAGQTQAPPPPPKKVEMVVTTPVRIYKESEASIRRQIVEVLGKYNNERTIEPLMHALNDPLSEIQLAAIDALQKYVRPHVMEAFRRKLEKSRNTPKVRIALIEALAYQKSTVAPAFFLGLFPAEQDENVIITYLKVFVDPFRMKMKEAEYLIVEKLSHSSTKVRLAAIKCIKELHLDNAADPLIQQAEKENLEKVVLKIRDCLIVLENYKVSIDLIRQIEKGKKYMKTLGGDVLSGYENKDFTITARVVKLMHETADKTTSLECLKVLSSYNNSKLSLPISYKLRDDYSAVRLAALNALGRYNRINRPEILDRIFYLSEREENSKVLEESASVLKKVNEEFIAQKAEGWVTESEKALNEATPDLTKAINFLTKAVGFFEKRVDLRLQLAELNFRIGLDDEAVRQYEIAVSEFASDEARKKLAEIYLNEGKKYLQNNQYPEAMLVLKKALKYNPEDTGIANKLAEANARFIEYKSFSGYVANAYLDYSKFEKFVEEYKGIDNQWKERAGFAYRDARQILESMLDDKNKSKQKGSKASLHGEMGRDTTNSYGNEYQSLQTGYIASVSEKQPSLYAKRPENDTASSEKEDASGFGNNITEFAQVEAEKENVERGRDNEQSLIGDIQAVKGQLNKLMKSQYESFEELSDKIIISYSDALRKLEERSSGKSKSRKSAAKTKMSKLDEKEEAVNSFKQQLLGFFEKKYSRESPGSPMRYKSKKESRAFVLAITPKPKEQKDTDLIYVRILYFPDTKKFDNKAEITLIFRNFNDGNAYLDHYNINYDIGEIREGEQSGNSAQSEEIRRKSFKKVRNSI